MKKAVYFSLFIPTIENSNYYSMLYHALETLQLVYKNQYDVVVFYSVPGTALDNHIHLNSFNLVKDFPWVKFIQSDYHVNHSNIYMHKWYNLEKVFDLNYDKVFYLDCDVVFNKDPSYMFDRYHDNSMWALIEGHDTLVYKFLNRPGVPSGQFIISKKLFDKCNNLHDRILLKQKVLIEQAYVALTKIEAEWFSNLSEQYAAQLVIQDSGVNIHALSIADVCFGVSAFTVKLINNFPVVSVGENAITHYFGKNDYIFVPDRLKTPDMHQKISDIDPAVFFNILY